MIHFVYCTQNLLDGKIYVGKHSALTLQDQYLGSGSRLREAIQKDGIHNFVRHILHICESEEEALFLESELVDEEFVSRENTYNVSVGGSGFTIDAARLGTYASHKTNWADPNFRARQALRNSRLHAEGKMKAPSFLGHHHSEASKKAIGCANAIHQSGEGNSQFGTLWVKNDALKRSQKIRQDELAVFIANGWVRGRKIRW
jgi:hypothetical protein